MTNKRLQKLIKNIRKRSRGQESNNRCDDEVVSQDITSHSSPETQNNALESQQDDEEFHEEGENEVLPSQRQPNRRGRTVMKDVHALHHDDLLHVTFNERGQPYGDLQPVLANYVGTIARNGVLLPLDYLDWRKVPKHRLEEAWKLVIARFIISDQHQDFVMQMMGVAWRRWRTEVKATSYDSNIPLEELVSIRPIPHGLATEVWERLCAYWKATELKENGRKPTRIEIMHLSRRSKKKGGAPVDAEAIRYENLLDEAVQTRLQDMPEGTQAIEVHEDAFRDVFGTEHSGRVRCLGAGALPSQVFPEQCRRSSFYNRQNYHSTLEMTNKFKEMQEQMKKDMEMRESQLRAEMEAQKAQLQTEMEKMRQMQDQFESCTRVMQSMISGGSSGHELLPTQMATVMTNIIQKHIYATSNERENDGRTPPEESSGD
ncbi:uncharacterized protein LOC142523433 isoform X2 [Primulina tabacum]|uniref:uncharacterized protein LOC142523433 isoform X2 n=1 Tax=Primulina tabacum TaxID=48773 RepID=UPI003F5A47A3